MNRFFKTVLLGSVWTLLGFGHLTAFAFNLGDQVQISSGTFNIRQTPAGTVLGTQTAGSLGVVTNGPTVATLNGTAYTWYAVNFNTGVDGWVSDTGLIGGPNYGTNFAEGFDVYSGNGTITWAPTVAAGEKFVFAKATEGVTFSDSRFATYMPAAKAAGLLAGAYHFGRPLNNPGTNGAVKEATNFLHAARAYITNGWLPPVLDVEDEPSGTDPNDPCSDGTSGSGKTSLNLVCKLGKTELSAWVRAWVNEVKRQTGITPALYMNKEYATTGMESDLAACPLWLVYHGTTPDFSPQAVGPWTNSWTFLQYSFTGNINGVSVPTVDLNKFSGDERALKLFAAQIATTNIIPPVLSGIGGGTIQPPANGQFKFEVSSASQSQVIIQSSTNLVTWTDAGTVTIDHSHGVFSESAPAGKVQKFYRAHP